MIKCRFKFKGSTVNGMLLHWQCVYAHHHQHTVPGINVFGLYLTQRKTFWGAR